MNVAVIHDWLGPMTGAERVLGEILKCYPGADVFTVLDYLPEEHRHVLGGARVTTSFVHDLPWARTAYWKYLPLMPLAVEQFDLSGYDVVISASHAVAKGVRVHPEQVHVCFLMTPMRFAWDLQDLYLTQFGYSRGLRSLVARLVFARLRQWDVASSNRVDVFLAQSRYIARRCQQCYRRDSVLLHPPADLDFFVPGPDKDDFYLAASRLTPFKRLDLIVEAFRHLPDRELVVVGDGPDRDRVRAAAGPNVTLLGYQPDDVLRDYMQRARAFLFAPPEDFGIVMVEAQACGTPVIAFGRGGARDIVRPPGSSDAATGLFFDRQDADAVAEAVRRFEEIEEEVTPANCRANAERFTPDRFRRGLTKNVQEALAGFCPQ